MCATHSILGCRVLFPRYLVQEIRPFGSPVPPDLTGR